MIGTLGWYAAALACVVCGLQYRKVGDLEHMNRLLKHRLARRDDEIEDLVRTLIVDRQNHKIRAAAGTATRARAISRN